MSGSDASGLNKAKLDRGDVWEVDLEPVEGREIGKKRPCVIVSNNIANRYSSVVVIVAVTSQPPKKPYPFMVKVPKTAGMPKESWVNCVYVRTVDKSRLRRFITNLDSDTMSKINVALAEQLGMNQPERT